MLSIIIPHRADRNEMLNDAILSASASAKFASFEYEILVESEGSKSAARNIAAKRAIGDILVFLDDDVIVRDTCFKELIQLFEHHQVGIVGGVNVAVPNISFEEEISASLWASPFTMMKSCARYTPRGGIRETDESELISCIMAVRKDAFFEAGGFPLDIIPCEENVLIQRVQELGYKVIYNPFAIVYHRRPKIWKQYWTQMFEYGYGRGLMMSKTQTQLHMFWRPSKRWPYYIAGFIVHYVAYVSGLVSAIVKSNIKAKTQHTSKSHQ
jgi:GT2 family glycosyltransferase